MNKSNHIIPIFRKNNIISKRPRNINKNTEFNIQKKHRINYFSNRIKLIWNKKLNELESFIIKNKRLPIQKKECKEEYKIYNWMANQKRNYKLCKCIMTNEKIYTSWKQFNEKYSLYFMKTSNERDLKLYLLEEYLKKNQKFPSLSDTNLYLRRLGKWIYSYKSKYDKQETIRYKKIYVFIKKNYNFFSQKENWFKKLERLQNILDQPNYIELIKNNPNLYQWTKYQISCFNNNEMINQKKYLYWKKFMENEKYNFFHVNNFCNKIKKKINYLNSSKKKLYEKNWFENFNKCININKTTLRQNMKIYRWYYRQRNNYNKKIGIMMYNKKILNAWEKYLTYK